MKNGSKKGSGNPTVEERQHAPNSESGFFTKETFNSLRTKVKIGKKKDGYGLNDAERRITPNSESGFFTKEAFNSLRTKLKIGKKNGSDGLVDAKRQYNPNSESGFFTKEAFNSLRTKLKIGKKKDIGNLIVEERQYILNSESGFFAKEAFNSLRTNLMFSLAEVDSNKVIIVTSALQSEGKSLIAVNLSISTAIAGYKVLLIDADMRRPKIGRLLQMKSELGLSDILVQPAKISQAIQPYRAGMDVLLAGTIPPNPSELLGSTRMKKLLETLRQRYDFVIFDTPPVNPVVDSVVLAPHTDGVLFVSRANHCDRSSVDRALEQLEYANINILGFVLNGISPDESGFANGGYRYKRYSRYGGKYGNTQGYGYSPQAGYGYSYGQQPMDPEKSEEWQSAVRHHANKQERK